MAWEDEFSDILNGSNRDSPQIKLATMTGPNSCKIGNLFLTSEDLLFSDRLLNQTCSKVSETAPDGGGTCTDKSTYIPPLKSGDTVVVYQISDSCFLVLERMVKA